LPAIGQEKKKKNTKASPPHTANTRTHNGPQLNGEWRTQKERKKKRKKEEAHTRLDLFFFSPFHPSPILIAGRWRKRKNKTKEKNATALTHTRTPGNQS
jgi:hypothetical protein